MKFATVDHLEKILWPLHGKIHCYPPSRNKSSEAYDEGHATFCALPGEKDDCNRPCVVVRARAVLTLS